MNHPLDAARRLVVVVLSIVLLLSDCVVRGPVTVKPLVPAEAVQVRTPVKAHLADGSIVVYPNGVTVANGKLIGGGTKYDLTLKDLGPIGEILLSDVVALETFENTTDRASTALASGVTTVVAIAGAALLAIAIFGSCPTVYGDVDGNQKLEAELFSYSINRLFEATDVDALRVKPAANGQITLNVRNEALETHNLNALHVIEVRHEPDEIVVPDQNESVVALSGISTAERVADRLGRDLRPLLDARDERVYRTDDATLRNAKKGDVRDWIDLEAPITAGRHEAALVLTMRNSLLNSVMFYDMMLKRAGARSLDWLSRDLTQIGPAFTLGSWYASQMGMRVEVLSDGAYGEVTHIGDTGPIAWKDMAVVIPLPPHEQRLRVRLSFVADNWRIDQIRVATIVRRPPARRLEVDDVIDGGRHDAAAVRSLNSADKQYLTTSPGQSFNVIFDAGADAPGVARTFLLESRGYYTEWIRPSWLATNTPQVFNPGDDVLLETVSRWRDVQADFEQRFEATRIPVR